jgi:hypothetical protein
MRLICKLLFIVVAGSGAFLGAQAQDDDAKGKKLVEDMCAACHEPAGWMHSKEEWEAIVPDHAARGGATPTEGELKLLVAYLTRHFGSAAADNPAVSSEDDAKSR